MLDDITSGSEPEQQPEGKASPSIGARTSGQQPEDRRSEPAATATWLLPTESSQSNASKAQIRHLQRPAASPRPRKAGHGVSAHDMSDCRIQHSRQIHENLRRPHRKPSVQGQAARRPSTSPALLPGCKWPQHAHKGITASSSGQLSEGICKSRTPDISPAARHGQSSSDALQQILASQHSHLTRAGCAGSSQPQKRPSAASNVSLSPGHPTQGKGFNAAQQGPPGHGPTSSCRAGADATKPDQPQLNGVDLADQLYAGQSTSHQHAQRPNGSDCGTAAALDKQRDRAAGLNDGSETCHLDKENRVGHEQSCEATQQYGAISLQSFSPHEPGFRAEVRCMRAASLLTASPAAASASASGGLRLRLSV